MTEWNSEWMTGTPRMPCWLTAAWKNTVFGFAVPHAAAGHVALGPKPAGTLIKPQRTAVSPLYTAENAVAGSVAGRLELLRHQFTNERVPELAAHYDPHFPVYDRAALFQLINRASQLRSGKFET